MGQEWYSCIKKLRQNALHESFWQHHNRYWRMILPEHSVRNQYKCQFKLSWMPDKYHFDYPLCTLQAEAAIENALMIINHGYGCHVSSMSAWYMVMEIHTVTSMTLFVLVALRNLINHKLKQMEKN